MLQTFEPGDGSFEIILGPEEQLPAEWNISGVIVLRETKPNNFVVIKDYTQILQ